MPIDRGLGDTAGNAVSGYDKLRIVGLVFFPELMLLLDLVVFFLKFDIVLYKGSRAGS